MDLYISVRIRLQLLYIHIILNHEHSMCGIFHHHIHHANIASGIRFTTVHPPFSAQAPLSNCVAHVLRATWCRGQQGSRVPVASVVLQSGGGLSLIAAHMFKYAI